MNNTGTKQVSIMKPSAFWREKDGEYKAYFKYSIPTFVEWVHKMQRLEVSSAVRLIYGSLGVKKLNYKDFTCSRNNSDSNKDVIFTPTTVLTDCAEIQQSAVNWMYVFDSEFRDFFYSITSVTIITVLSTWLRPYLSTV